MSHKCPSCESDLIPISDYGYKVEFYCPYCHEKVMGARHERIREIIDEVKDYKYM